MDIKVDSVDANRSSRGLRANLVGGMRIVCGQPSEISLKALLLRNVPDLPTKPFDPQTLLTQCVITYADAETDLSLLETYELMPQNVRKNDKGRIMPERKKADAVEMPLAPYVPEDTQPFSLEYIKSNQTYLKSLVLAYRRGESLKNVARQYGLKTEEAESSMTRILRTFEVELPFEVLRSLRIDIGTPR